MKKYIITISALLAFSGIFAQQTPQLTLRMYDPIIYNPAIAGSNSYPEIKVHHRSQWTGFSGSPLTSIFSYHTELNPKMGIGGYIINDMIGPSRRTMMNVSYAYHLKFPSFFWSLGLSGNLMQYNLNGKEFFYKDQDDLSLASGSVESRYSPDASFGTYLYNQNFFVGLSVMQLVATKLNFYKDESVNAIVQLKNHYYFTGGYIYKATNEIDLEPSLLISKAIGNPYQVDFNIKMDYLRKYVLGVTYRHKSAVSLLAGFRYKRYFIAYSFDLATTKLRTVNSGSHEIIFAFNWPFVNDTKPLFDLKGVQKAALKKRFIN